MSDDAVGQPESPLSDGDHDHLAWASTTDPVRMVFITRCLDLVRWVLDAPGMRAWDTAFANEVGAAVCFVRSYRAVRCAAMLTAFGYYGEVGAVLRSAYEAGSLGRMLAAEPELADRWMNEDAWFPDRQVRRWIDEHRGEGSAIIYRDLYGMLSDQTHPTRRSTMQRLVSEEHGWWVRHRTEPDPSQFEAAESIVAACALWLCYALRNSMVSEEALPPDWRRELAALREEAAALFGIDRHHLEPDWEEIDERWQTLQTRLRSAQDLDEALADHPLSWQNLKNPPTDR